MFHNFVKQQVAGEAYDFDKQMLQTDDVLLRVAGKHGGHGHGGEGDEFDIMAIGINSMIHTIEFALGTISNTASYLRLWALSLAHSQLAQVFFDMLLASSLESGSVIGVSKTTVSPPSRTLRLTSRPPCGTAIRWVLCVGVGHACSPADDGRDGSHVAHRPLTLGRVHEQILRR